jgi:SAM-dependent methyltransferase
MGDYDTLRAISRSRTRRPSARSDHVGRLIVRRARDDDLLENAHVMSDGYPFSDETAEVMRIRAAYGKRDARPTRHRAIADAYRLVNADRLSRMRIAIERAAGLRPRILDVGCGGGLDLNYWLSVGWSSDALAGVDLVEDRIAVAIRRCPGVDLRVTSGSDLPFPADSFDVATAVTVFSSILDAAVRRRLFAEMQRVVRPGGSIFVYDFVIKNPSNRDVVAMTPNRLRDLGAAPIESISMTPLIHLVALASRFGRSATEVAMRIAPRTHRLSRFLVSGRQPALPLTDSLERERLPLIVP